MLPFDSRDIHQLADRGTYLCGETYYLEGRVTLLNLSAADLVLAQVEGARPYLVRLHSSENGFYGQCSCPVGDNCKHVVATALEYLDQQQGTNLQGGRSPVEAWLQQWPARQSPAEPDLEPMQHYLMYILVPDYAGALCVEFVKAYLKKDGNWGQAKPYQPSILQSQLGYREHFLLPIDEEILQHMDHSFPHGFQLEGRRGGNALALMLGSGRVFLGDMSRPLTQASACPLNWQWQEEEGEFSLQPLGTYKLLPVLPLHYLDPAAACVGSLESELADEEVLHLAKMPPLSPTELPVVAAELAQRLPTVQLPELDEEFQLEQRSRARPVLTLVAQHDAQGAWLPGCVLAFDYDGCRIPLMESPVNTCVRTHQGREILLLIDTKTEQAALKRLAALGLGTEEMFGEQGLIWRPGAPSIDEFVEQWQQLLDTGLAQLEAEGWLIETDAGYRFDLHQANFELNITDAENSWFELGLQLEFAGQSLDTLWLIECWLEQNQPDTLYLPTDTGCLQIDASRLQSISQLVIEMYHQEKTAGIKLASFEAVQLAGQAVLDLDLREAPVTAQLIDKLANYAGLEPVASPAGLQAQLRDYQQQGLAWLSFLQEYQFGGILADDMGLGKTLQTLALVQRMREAGQLDNPAMVLAPTSLMGNWLQEAQQFTPELNVCLIHGPQRAQSFKQVTGADLIVTSYPLLLRDLEQYQDQNFSLLVLDEAQAIKNPKTKLAKQVRQLKGQRRLCLTGTPLENHLGELWALMDFALPGLLGGWQAFNQTFRRPIEQGDVQAQQRLAQRVAPFMLRRTKEAVVAELPPKTEMLQYVELGGAQGDLYEAIRISMEKRIRELVARKGMARSHIEFLDALLKLRQACIDPRLVKLDKAQNIDQSAKMDWLEDTLPEMVAEGRQVLLFSQFTQVLGLVEGVLKDHKIKYTKLTGQTRKRQQAIDAFQSGEARVFLISLKAGGSGLNLTAADTVIHMDPWWNPAVEQQATDRAYRIGQDKPVFVYKLVAMGTVEERIQQMQTHKQAIADALFDATGKAGLPADSEALLDLLA